MAYFGAADNIVMIFEAEILWAVQHQGDFEWRFVSAAPEIRTTTMPIIASVFVGVPHSRNAQKLAKIKNEYSITAT